MSSYKVVTKTSSVKIEEWVSRRKCTIKRRLHFVLVIQKGHHTHLYVQTNKPSTCTSMANWFWRKAGIECRVNRLPRAFLKTYFRENKPFPGTLITIVGTPFLSGRGKMRWHQLPRYIPPELAETIITFIGNNASIPLINKTINDKMPAIDRYTKIKLLQFCWFQASFRSAPPLKQTV